MQIEFPEIMTATQAAEYLNISRPLFNEHVKSGSVPFFKASNAPNSQKRFKKSLLDKWAEKRSINNEKVT